MSTPLTTTAAPAIAVARRSMIENSAGKEVLITFRPAASTARARSEEMKPWSTERQRKGARMNESVAPTSFIVWMLKRWA